MAATNNPTPAAIHAAGAVAGVAWALLAWRSHQAGAPPLLPMLAVVGVAWVALGTAWRFAPSASARALIGWAVVFRVAAGCALPVMEDDHHRFLWDGYRFASTGNPYATAPRASFDDATVPPEFRAMLDRINHPDVPTIYGPALQWAFRLCHAIAPGQLWPWKLVQLAAELALIALLWRGLPVRGRLLLAWCPLAIFEIGFNVHPDVLAIAPLVAAWWLGRRGWIVAAGAAMGLALAAKIFAVLLAPFVLWRLGWRAWLAAAAVVVACYAPFWLRGSAADLAGLRAIAAEWEFNSSVYALVAAVSSPVEARMICGLAFAAIGLVLFARWRAAAKSRPVLAPDPLPPGESVYGFFLLFSAVANPWYALWLWPFVAVRPSSMGIAALSAVSLAYVTGLNLGDAALGNFGHPWWLRPVEFGVIALVAAWAWRKRKPARETSERVWE